MPHDFVIADVFTSTPFEGNQPAVFYDAQGLSDRAMQAFAQEINFAESTFVPPPTDPKYACRVRIFTLKRNSCSLDIPRSGPRRCLPILGE